MTRLFRGSTLEQPFRLLAHKNDTQIVHRQQQRVGNPLQRLFVGP